ncbi:MAG TPA: alpha-1,4-glucan--maltose-1-phosphate maltosyltransferase [Dehalococcoidia bacterium]|nr:alpha-1,4-glucan--maltose-1-phosphate maltosyltransferase [Dehalococcoidia bacterium]
MTDAPAHREAPDAEAVPAVPSAPERAPSRVAVERLYPEIDGGRFPAKRVAGDEMVVEVNAVADGHDELRCALLHRRDGATAWTETPMTSLVNDRWRGSFPVPALGAYEYTAEAWIDRFRTWRRDFERRLEVRQDVAVELLVAAQLVGAAAARTTGEAARKLHATSRALLPPVDVQARIKTALDETLLGLMDEHGERANVTRYPRTARVMVDPPRAAFSAWYELFPRSASTKAGKHGTFRDVIDRLPYIAGLGFDVLYLPPIHPIGITHRKGKNNAVTCGIDDPGSPWAIGAGAGGHTAIHPKLGTIDDFRALVRAAGEHGMDVALDIAFQCSPDHPWITEHPLWFRRRPDGTARYAENPPKKYEDIYPLDFESGDWRGLWEALRDVFLYWAEQGVHIFRVDNPHTKPFAFWEWVIAEVKRAHPEALFLAEAFTRPQVMYELAKVGFSQSYTYFAWRNSAWELRQYFEELTQTELSEFFRPNLWPNTPDILTEYLQAGGEPAFRARLLLAATLGANYGIYGPSFEKGEAIPRAPGSEEYRDSEKYEVRTWDVDESSAMADFIRRVNAIRRENEALHNDRSLRFHPVDNEQLLCYSKQSADGESVIVVVVNVDPHFTQSGWVHLPPADVGMPDGAPFQVHDLLGDARYIWEGDGHFVQLDPRSTPAHIFAVRKKLRSEREFEYYF